MNMQWLSGALEDARALSKNPSASSPRPPIHAAGKSPTCCQWKHKGWPWVPQKIFFFFQKKKKRQSTVAVNTGRMFFWKEERSFTWCWRVHTIIRTDSNAIGSHCESAVPHGRFRVTVSHPYNLSVISFLLWYLHIYTLKCVTFSMVTVDLFDIATKPMVAGCFLWSTRPAVTSLRASQRQVTYMQWIFGILKIAAFLGCISKGRVWSTCYDVHKRGGTAHRDKILESPLNQLIAGDTGWFYTLL